MERVVIKRPIRESNYIARTVGSHTLECLECFKRFTSATKFVNHLNTIDCYRRTGRFGSILQRALRD